MPRVLMLDPITENIALYDEPAGASGAFDDPNSDRNAPLNDPIAWLDHVRFHPDFDYYQVHSGPTAVTINHAAVAGATTTLYNLGGATFARTGQIVTTQIDLVTHSLGYIPSYFVIMNGALVAPGTLIQVGTAQDRQITPYATTTKIRLHEAAISSASTLAAVSIDYEVVVFRQPVADMPGIAFDFDETTGRVVMGYGKFDSDLKMLREAGALGDSPFDISLGRTVDIKNGGKRSVLADGTTVSDTNYNGTFTGSPSFQGAVE